MDKIIKVAGATALQVLPILKRCAEEDPSANLNTARKRARLSLYKNIHSDTLYGKISQTTVLTGPTGQVDLFHLNHLSLFVKAAERSHLFFSFMMLSKLRAKVNCISNSYYRIKFSSVSNILIHKKSLCNWSWVS